MHVLYYFCCWSHLSEEKHKVKLNGFEEKNHAQKSIYESKLLHCVQSTAKKKTKIKKRMQCYQKESSTLVVFEMFFKSNF